MIRLVAKSVAVTMVTDVYNLLELVDSTRRIVAELEPPSRQQNCGQIIVMKTAALTVDAAVVAAFFKVVCLEKCLADAMRVVEATVLVAIRGVRLSIQVADVTMDANLIARRVAVPAAVTDVVC